jgi:hypothetical protein
MHYILISMSIAPAYVSAFKKPSSGGQSFIYALHLLVQFLKKLVHPQTKINLNSQCIMVLLLPAVELCKIGGNVLY